MQARRFFGNGAHFQNGGHLEKMYKMHAKNLKGAEFRKMKGIFQNGGHLEKIYKMLVKNRRLADFFKLARIFKMATI